MVPLTQEGTVSFPKGQAGGEDTDGAISGSELPSEKWSPVSVSGAEEVVKYYSTV